MGASRRVRCQVLNHLLAGQRDKKPRAHLEPFQQIPLRARIRCFSVFFVQPTTWDTWISRGSVETGKRQCQVSHRVPATEIRLLSCCGSQGPISRAVRLCWNGGCNLSRIALAEWRMLINPASRFNEAWGVDDHALASCSLRVFVVCCVFALAELESSSMLC